MGRVLVAGGYSDNAILASVAISDPESREFTQAIELLEARVGISQHHCPEIRF
jgi:hypothetical protein